MVSVTCKPHLLSVVMLNDVMLSVVKLNVVMLSVTCKPHLLSVVMLNVVMLSIVAPFARKDRATPSGAPFMCHSLGWVNLHLRKYKKVQTL
jgi:hypothetical protein